MQNKISNNKQLSVNYHLFLLFLVFLVTTNFSFATVFRMPYLQAVTHTQAVIMVESSDTSAITVLYGKEAEKAEVNNNVNNKENKAETQYIIETENTPVTYVHRVVLTNLKPSSKYFYHIDKKTPIKKGIDGILNKYSFYTANTLGEKFDFVVMGDSRSGPKIFNQITKLMAKHQPHFALYLGDLAFKKDYIYWEDEFFIENNEKLIANVPFYNSVGSHEKWTQNTQAFTDSPNSEISEHKAYYSFDWGDCHFLVLSTEHPVSENSKQFKFAEQDLQNSKAKFKIVTFHVPAYSVGAHGENKNMKNFTSKVFEKYGVTMVLAGHSHYYQHNKINGISHFVLGGGGSPLYTPGTKDYTLISEKKYHYAYFQANPDSLKMTVIDKDGNTIDEIEFK